VWTKHCNNTNRARWNRKRQ